MGKIKSVYYVLDDHVAEAVSDLDAWVKSPKTRHCHVADTTIGNVRVSTVFLGVNHAPVNGPPQIFESMVFGGTQDGEQDRYATWAEAERGHAVMVAWIKSHTP